MCAVHYNQRKRVEVMAVRTHSFPVHELLAVQSGLPVVPTSCFPEAHSKSIAGQNEILSNAKEPTGHALRLDSMNSWQFQRSVLRATHFLVLEPTIGDGY